MKNEKYRECVCEREKRGIKRERRMKIVGSWREKESDRYNYEDWLY